MKIVFLMGSPDISGGTYVIFQHALALMREGHEVSIIPLEEPTEKRLQWYSEAAQFTWETFDGAADREYDMAIATWWKTVYEMHRVKAKRYVYFVQSIESRFYVEEEKPLRQLVEATYMLPLYIITEATWIKNYLFDKYRQEAWLARNGIRKDIYTPEGESYGRREEGKLRVLVEGTVESEFKNIPRTVELCRQSEADEIWLMTPSSIKSYDGVSRVFSRVPILETARVYRSCDVLVKLSYVEGMFGPPLEMFHCGGTSITYDVTGHDEYIKNGENAIVIPTDHEEEVVEAINRLKLDKNELARLKKNAAQTAAEWPDWEMSSAAFIRALSDIAGRPERISQQQLEIETKFHFDSYVIGENYRLQLPMGKQSALMKLKWYLKVNHSGLFYALKKIKTKLFA